MHRAPQKEAAGDGFGKFKDVTEVENVFERLGQRRAPSNSHSNAKPDASAEIAVKQEEGDGEEEEDDPWGGSDEEVRTFARVLTLS